MLQLFCPTCGTFLFCESAAPRRPDASSRSLTLRFLLAPTTVVHLAALRFLRSVNESVHGNESAEFYCKLCPYKYDVKEVVSDRDLRRLAFVFSALSLCTLA